MGFERGHRKFGGRKKGVQNTTTRTQKEWIDSVLSDGREKFAEDMKKLQPSEFVKTYLALLQYVIPRQTQSINYDAQIQAEYKRLEMLMQNAPDDFVSKIADKIALLQTN